jgi:FMN-dependent oxidoreductase (nitrilotriacetate monooxygenase family)
MPDQPKQLHLNAFVFDIGHHEAAWRLPESDPFATTDVAHFRRIAEIAEAAKFDSLFLADAPALLGEPAHRPAGGLEPTTLLAALSATTTHIGLIATASTTYSEPYNLARQFASLDHISGGRAGWNIVTTATEDAARNFGREGLALHRDRYARATDFLEVVQKLWDSWEDDAAIADKATGRFADPAKIHEVAHRGDYFHVQGALNVPRSPQGRPLLVQAGSSENGKAFAARTAEAVFTAQRTLEEGQAFYADLKARTRAAGRRDDDIKILPGIVPFIGSTEAEARALEATFEELIVPAYGLKQLSSFFGVDLTGAALDDQLPPVPAEDEIEGAKSRSTLVAQLARRERLTVRQLIGKLGGGRGHRTFTGTPEQVADTIEEWFLGGAADGFNIMPAALPSGLETFAEQVVPLLRARGLFREDYTGSTLRDHYGLARPESQYAAAPAGALIG